MVGVSLAAFTIAASIFALFLYLTLYIQDDLGYGPFAAGVRFLPITILAFIVAPVAGKLTVRIHARYLLGIGLLLISAGCLLMATTHPTSGWTVLLPGFIVSGIGIGTVNPVLASSAISVVPPQRSGMASGANNTFRQVGIATGIAGLGSIFSHTVRTHIVAMLQAAPHLSAGAAHTLATSVAEGSGAKASLSSVPAAARQAAGHAVRASFVTGLNEIFLVGAILTLVASVLTLVLIRSQDFETGAARGGPVPGGSEPASSPEGSGDGLRVGAANGDGSAAGGGDEGAEIPYRGPVTS
jgi:MFS family permease